LIISSEPLPTIICSVDTDKFSANLLLRPVAFPWGYKCTFARLAIIASRARLLIPRGFSFETNLMISDKPYSRFTSSRCFPGIYGSTRFNSLRYLITITLHPLPNQVLILQPPADRCGGFRL